MKKLLALLFACTVINCTFSSCGKEESSNNSTEKSVSQPEPTRAVTTEEVTTQVVTTEPETTSQPETEAATEADVSEENIVGMWVSEDHTGNFIGFDFKDNGNVDIFMDTTTMAHFTADGKLMMKNSEKESEFESQFDGTTLSINASNMDILTMTKDSGDSDSLDGEYTLVSGAFYDSMKESSGFSEMYMIVSGESMYLGYKNLLSYKTDRNNISISGLDKIDFGNGNNFDTTYTVNDDVLVISGLGKDKDMELVKFDPYDSTSITHKDIIVTTEENTTVDTGEVSVDDSLTGAWIMPDEIQGYVFNGDGTGNIFMDFTEIIHFTSDGKFIFSNRTIDSENIEFDGTKLSVKDTASDLLVMTKKDNNKDTFNGEYILESGDVYESSIESIGKVFNVNPQDINVYATVNGEKIYIEFSGIFTYSTDNGNITFTGLSGKGIPDGSVIPYKVENDKFILTNNSDTELVFQKINF